MLGSVRSHAHTFAGHEESYLCSSKMNRASMVLILLLCHCSPCGLGCEVRDGVGSSAGVSSLMMQAPLDPASSHPVHPPRISAFGPDRPHDMATEVHPPTFKEALKQDRAQFDDCTPCRVVGMSSRCQQHHLCQLTPNAGSATFVGLGAFTYVSGHSQLHAQEAVIRQSKTMFGMGSRRAAITTTSAVFVGLGVYRWFA